MQTLILDTSGSFTTVLVVTDGKLSASSIVQDRPAEHLHQQIDTSLTSTSIKPPDLDQISVVTGPGSWTGLNIGVTTAKTLSQVLQIPLIPIRTLDVLTIQYAGRVWGIMHAGRNRCYYAIYTNSDNSEMDVLPIDTVISQIESENAPVRIIEYGETFADRFINNPHYLTTDRLKPENLIVATQRATPLDRQAIRFLTPVYLQPSHVERGASL